MTAPSEIGVVDAQGTPRQIGRLLGCAGRAAAHTVLVRAPYWRAVTDPARARLVRTMGINLRQRFPAIWEELQGLAEGLDLPFDDVLAWNCRGDLLSNVPDGCTTVMLPGAVPVIAHNEDGLPGFRGHEFLTRVQPDHAPGFLSFCYPGSLPGHTFAATEAGIVQAVNNIRLNAVEPEIPRMVLGRAVLSCVTTDEATHLLGRQNRCGGFHMTLAQAGRADLLSVEFGAGACSVVAVEAPMVHANHALHLPLPEGGQSVTRSSADRQARGEALLGRGVIDPLTILRDREGPGLPICRTDPDDPDDENTLATAIFRIGNRRVRWQVLVPGSAHPLRKGSLGPR